MSWISPAFQRFWVRAGSRGFWALGDQGVVSLGSFASTLVLARRLPTRDYGVYAVLLGVIYFLNSIHFSLVTYPLSIKVAAQQSNARQNVAVALGMTLAFAVVNGVVLAIAAYMTGEFSAFPWVATAALSWQAQELCRRTLMAELRHRDAIIGDALSYLGQAILLFALSGLHRLDLQAAFFTMATTSLAAFLIQAGQAGWPARIVWRHGLSTGLEYWNSGKWVLFSNLVGVPSIQAFPWVLAMFRGPQVAAGLQSVINLLAVTNPLMVGMANLALPIVSKVNSESNARLAFKPLFQYGAIGVALLFPYYSVLELAPAWALGVVYGRNSAYVGMAWALRAFAAAYAFNYAAHMLGTFFSGIDKSRDSFHAQLVGAVVALTIGLPLAAWKGVLGACAGYLIVHVARTMVLHRHLQREGIRMVF